MVMRNRDRATIIAEREQASSGSGREWGEQPAGVGQEIYFSTAISTPLQRSREAHARLLQSGAHLYEGASL